MNSLITRLSIALCLIINTACSDKTNTKEPAKTQEHIQPEMQHYKKLPQGFFEGLPFPANKEQAKTAGFTNCDSRNEDEYTCTLNRKLKHNGYEFDLAYIELNTSYNLADYEKNAELGYSASNTVSETSTPDEYSYRTIHLYTKSESDPLCVKEKKTYIFSATEGCSSGEKYLDDLKNKGWLMRWEGDNQSRISVYYTKDGSYRLINHGVILPINLSKPSRFHLELEPLSPKSYGVDYKSIFDENELEKQLKSKRNDFIDSMNN